VTHARSPRAGPHPGRRWALALGLALAGACGATPARAAIRYASPSGGGDCSSQAQACDLPNAVTKASSGDTVNVLPGAGAPPTNDYSVSALTVPGGVTVQGQAGVRKPVITITSSGFTMGASSTLAGLDVINADAAGTGVTLASSASGVTLEGVQVYMTGSGASAVSVPTGTSATVRDSLLVTTGANGVGLTVAGGSAATPVIARNLTVYSTGTASSGVVVTSTAPGVPPVCLPAGGSAGALSLRNTIARGTTSDIATALAGCSGGPASLSVGYSNFRADHATVEAGPIDQSPGHNQTSPDLTAAGAIFAGGSDLHQLPSSPTVNAGVSDMLGATDFDGDPRILEATVDIGADEMIPAPTVTTGGASTVSATSATLGGTVNPNAFNAYARFDYGPTIGYGSLTPLAGLGSGTAALSSSATLGGLTPGTLYHFRAEAATVNAALNQFRVAYGSDHTFTTASAPPPGGGGRTGTVAPVIHLAFTLGSRTVRISRSGSGSLSLSCVAPAGDRCAVSHGRLSARSPARGNGKVKGKLITVGSVSGRVLAGRRSRLSVRLSSSGRRLLGVSGRLRASLTATVSDRAGESRPLSTRLQLTGARARPRRGA
jgi:hypothetical protein